MYVCMYVCKKDNNEKRLYISLVFRLFFVVVDACFFFCYIKINKIFITYSYLFRFFSEFFLKQIKFHSSAEFSSLHLYSIYIYVKRTHTNFKTNKKLRRNIQNHFADELGKICSFLLFSFKLVAITKETADWSLSRDDEEVVVDDDDDEDDDDDGGGGCSVEPFCFLCTLSS